MISVKLALSESVRRLSIGAEPKPCGGVDSRVAAPGCREVAVEIDGLDPALMTPEADGYFSAWVRQARAGMRYRFRLDRAEKTLPDPASRFQPDGPHGASEIIDPDGFAWSDAAWRAIAREQLVIYGLHAGTCTRECNWPAAQR